MQPASQPGWYPDPWQPYQLRWFDGYQWTPHVSGAPPVAEGLHPDSAAHWLLPLGRSWQAITAGYVGLLSIVIVFLGPLAIGFGVWGLMVANKQGSHGRGRSLFGIVAGLWGTVITLVLLTNG
jgi:hypothetical protein